MRMDKIITLIFLVIISDWATAYDYGYSTYPSVAPAYNAVPVMPAPVVPPVYSSYSLGGGVTQYDVPTVSPSGHVNGTRSVVCVQTGSVTVCN